MANNWFEKPGFTRLGSEILGCYSGQVRAPRCQEWLVSPVPQHRPVGPKRYRLPNPANGGLTQYCSVGLPWERVATLRKPIEGWKIPRSASANGNSGAGSGLHVEVKSRGSNRNAGPRAQHRSRPFSELLTNRPEPFLNPRPYARPTAVEQ